jgi:hypothetical protein
MAIIPQGKHHQLCCFPNLPADDKICHGQRRLTKVNGSLNPNCFSWPMGREKAKCDQVKVCWLLGFWYKLCRAWVRHRTNLIPLLQSTIRHSWKLFDERKNDFLEKIKRGVVWGTVHPARRTKVFIVHRSREGILSLSSSNCFVL